MRTRSGRPVYAGRNVLADLIAIPLHQAAGDDEALGAAAALALVLHHLKDGIDRLLLGRVDEAAGVDDEDVRVFGPRCQLAAGAVEQAHHHLGVNEVFGAAERDKADLRTRGRDRPRGLRIDGIDWSVGGRVEDRGRHSSILVQFRGRQCTPRQ
jgi:hypothetical protein